jgi:hypothetical protein
MSAQHSAASADQAFDEFQHKQLEHFRRLEPRCKAMQLPEGLLLRYTLAKALYFYLRSGVRDGKIATRIYASDSPYDRQKAHIGEVTTPMFESDADFHHLVKVQALLRAWVNFVKDGAEGDQDFTAFPVDPHPQV